MKITNAWELTATAHAVSRPTPHGVISHLRGIEARGGRAEFDEMSEGRRLAGQTLIRGLAFALSGGVSFLLLPIYTRFLVTSEYGALDVILSLNRALVIPASLGIGNGLGLVLREGQPAEQPRKVTSALLAQATWLILLISALAAAAPLVGHSLFGAEERTTTIRLGFLLLAAQVLFNFTVGVANWKRSPRGSFCWRPARWRPRPAAARCRSPPSRAMLAARSRGF